MKRIFLALFIVVAFCGQALAAEKFILFVNNTNEQIKQIHLAPAGTKEWGPNLLDKWKLHPDKSVKVSVPHDRGNCKWDLKYVVREKMMYIITDVNICNAVELDIFNQDGATWVNIK